MRDFKFVTVLDPLHGKLGESSSGRCDIALIRPEAPSRRQPVRLIQGLRPKDEAHPSRESLLRIEKIASPSPFSVDLRTGTLREAQVRHA
jgi:hypothetical protein